MSRRKASFASTMRSSRQMTTPMMLESTKLRQRASLCTRPRSVLCSRSSTFTTVVSSTGSIGLGEVDFRPAFQPHELIVRRHEGRRDLHHRQWSG